jgi:hypothetical protein
MRALAIGLLSLAACTRVSATYCDEHPDDLAHCTAPDAGVCSSDPDCAALDPSTPVCLDQASCVQCAPDRTSACTDTTPVCGDDHRCHACTSHDECGSGICLDTGACAAPADVAYVQGGAVGDCTSPSSPCGSLEDARASGRTIFKVSGAVADDRLTSLTTGSYRIYGTPGASVTRAGTGVILQVKGTANVAIYDLRFTHGLADGIEQADTTSVLALTRVIIDENAGYGLSAHYGTLTMNGCVVSGNNFGGVSAADVRFTITNSIFVVNGDGSQSTVGGLRLSPLGDSRFEFNTVADNFSTTGNHGTRSLNCTAALTVRNNIFRTNYPSTTGISPLCTAEFSLFDQLAPTTGDNKTGDPMFDQLDPLVPDAPAYYRITAGSPAADSADPSASMSADIDGDPRPANGRSDIGADELP